jgi:transcriptional regulator with XRE-family HTH domain
MSDAPILRIVGGRDLARNMRVYNARVGSILKAWRMEAGFSLASVGESVSLNASQIMRYENGVTPITVPLASRLCAMYGRGLKALMDAAHVD